MIKHILLLLICSSFTCSYEAALVNKHGLVGMRKAYHMAMNKGLEQQGRKSQRKSYETVDTITEYTEYTLFL